MLSSLSCLTLYKWLGWALNQGLCRSENASPNASPFKSLLTLVLETEVVASRDRILQMHLPGHCQEDKAAKRPSQKVGEDLREGRALGKGTVFECRRPLLLSKKKGS